MRKISADTIFPVTSPPIKNGVVIIDDDGKIIAIDERKNYDPAELEICNGVISPGFINAHCHLELSYMRGKIPPQRGMAQFIIDLIDYRKRFLFSDDPERLEEISREIRNAEAEMISNGIVGTGDISNDDYTFSLKQARPLRYHTFIECFGFFPAKADQYFLHSVSLFEKAKKNNLSVSITPHAPYSVPPELFKMIFSYRENSPVLFSYHNQESQAENIFFESGSGDFMHVFDHFNIPLSVFHPTGSRSPVSVIDYFPRMNNILFVHNTFTSANDISVISTHSNQAWWCFCPNANIYIESQLPDFTLFKDFPERICLGTDSLASNHKISILEEMKTIQRLDRSIAFELLVQWATLNGAKFFGWDDLLGSLEAGKSPGLNLISSLDEEGKLTENSVVSKLV